MATHDIIIGGSIPGISVIHRLDPRTKLCGLIVLLVAVFVERGRWGVPATGLLVLAIAAMTGTGLRVWIQGLRKFLWMFGIAGGVHLLFPVDGSSLMILGRDLPITTSGIERSLMLVGQLAQAVVLSLAITFTTTPTDLTRGARRLASPLGRFGVRLDEYAMVMFLALRFVPLLQQELRATVEAQTARGVAFHSGSVTSRARTFISVLVPALLGALRRADILATAMVARGYHPGKPRSEYRPLVLSRRDGIAAAIIAVFVVCRFTVIP